MAQSHSGVALDDSSLARHALTGAFEEPAVEVAFTVGFFRDAFPLHVFLLATMVVIQLFVLFGHAESWSTEVVFLILGIIALIGRVLLHRVHDQVLSQRLGSRFWTASMVLGLVVDIGAFLVDPELVCRNAEKQGVVFEHQRWTMWLLLGKFQ